MTSLPSLLSLVHVIGLALGLGGATAKLMLLLGCKADPARAAAYMVTARPLTRLIILGLVLLILSGVAWLFLGYQLTPILVAKLTMVAAILVLGPVIDTVIEPKFRLLTPDPGASASPAFIRSWRRYALLEGVATGLFYLIVVMWTLFR